MNINKNIRALRGLFLVFALFLSLSSYAQESEARYNPLSHSATSQAITPDARAGSMGDVGAATDPDVNSQYWNPAKYPFCISRAGVALNYTPWLRQLVSDMDLAYLSGYYRIGEYSAVSGSLRYFSMGEVFTSFDVDAMTIRPYEMSLDVGYSMMLSENFSIGASLRWLYSNLSYDLYTENSKPGSAFAADIAMYYQNYIQLGARECQLGLGLNISNIGTKIKISGNDDRADFIPTNMRLGASLMIPVNEYNRFTIAGDLNKLLIPSVPTQSQYNDAVANGSFIGDYDEYCMQNYYNVNSVSGIFKSFSDAPGGFKEEMEEINWGLGGEYVYNDQFSIRAGYHHEAENKGNRKYFTVGAGFRMNVFSLDAAYTIATAKSNPLDQMLRFSLTFDMDGLNDLFK